MKFFYWNKTYEIGIPEIDIQHRRLVDLINGLAAVISDGGKLPHVQTMISELIDYAAVHFSEEEALMESAPLSDDDKALHRRAHRGFVEKTNTMFQRSDLLHAEVATEVLEFLTTWLISHILGSDTKIAAALMPGRAIPDPSDPLVEISPVERLLIGALSETERRFRLISDHTPALIWVADATGARGFVNRAWAVFLGVDGGTVEDTSCYDFMHPDDRAGYKALIEGLLAKPEPAEAEYRLKKYDGKYRWILEKILPRFDSGNLFMGLIASGTDITAIKEAETLLSQSNKELEEEVARRTAQLEQLMLTDPLTGVGNRRQLTTRLDDEVQRAHRYGRALTLVFFDIDHFKHVNDTYGHAIGDLVLVRVAESLKSNVRDSDLLGRFGGEEFIVLLVETPIDAAVSLVERMRAAISALDLPDLSRSVTVSAGVAELRVGETAEGLLKRSDQALYRAKNAGRDRYEID